MTYRLVECSYDPAARAGQPIGMFHCPDCGAMVLAGLPHPRSLDETFCAPELEHYWDNDTCLQCGVQRIAVQD